MQQGSALSPLLFVIVMEALSREFRVALLGELLYADDLVVIAETRDAPDIQFWFAAYLAVFISGSDSSSKLPDSEPDNLLIYCSDFHHTLSFQH